MTIGTTAYSQSPRRFLKGVILKQGAEGDTVGILQRRLRALYERGDIRSKINYYEYKNMSFGKSTAAALREYTGVTEVDAGIWSRLGLVMGDTWEDMFAPRTAASGSTIRVEIKDNTAIIKWYPRIVIYEYTGRLKKRRLSPEDAVFDDCLRRIFSGVLRWASNAASNPNPLSIYHVSGEVLVEIYDKDNRLYTPDGTGYRFAADGYFDSNVAISIGRRDKAMVWDAFRWRKNKKLRVTIALPKDRAASLDRTMEHEFGHVLGLFDAYGYAKKRDPADGHFHYGGHRCPDRLLPPTFIDGEKLARNSVMVCDYMAVDESCGPKVRFCRTSRDYEMLLFAWRDDKLQLFTDSILGKRSQAFFH